MSREEYRKARGDGVVGGNEVEKRGGYAKQSLLHSIQQQHVMLTLPRPIWFRHIKIFAILPVLSPFSPFSFAVVVNILGLVGAYRV